MVVKVNDNFRQSGVLLLSLKLPLSTVTSRLSTQLELAQFVRT
jgi:hypothetical protein